MADHDRGFRALIKTGASYAKLVEAYGENIVLDVVVKTSKDVAKFRAAGEALYKWGGGEAMDAAARVLRDNYGEGLRANGILLDRLWDGVGDWKSG